MKTDEQPDPTVIVIFGGAGDLTWRKLIPSLYDLQRDGRMLDFFLEDVAPYSDEQVGNAVRGVHTPVKETLERFFKFAPVIDGVEGTSVQTPGKDPALVKFIGNVPATPPSGGVLRHRGWQVTQVDFPAFPAGQNLKLIAPAELEIE